MSKKFVCRKDYPVVQTAQGKLRGFLEENIFKFYGIKYADAKRWQMPVPVEKWEGIKDALGYGYVCPMLEQDKPGSGELKVPHRYWPLDENCQYLNVWTPSIEDGKKRPVMFWLHGGGYFAGSSIEQIAYDGTNMAEYGDVVVVTINHRLNILGYLNLEEYGDEYKNSANVGDADIVAALKWVHENIAGFGGDPENVTIFGQSGGGMKVADMMQIPDADGLFHKAIMMSGCPSNMFTSKSTDGKPFVEALMKGTGVKTVRELAEVPYDELAKVYNKIAPELIEKTGYNPGNGPVKNDWFMGNPAIYDWTEHSKEIPLLIGSVIDEFKGFAPGRADRHTMTDAEALAMVKTEYGDKAEGVIELFKKAYPGKSLCDLMAIDTVMRPAGIEVVKSRIAAGATAPTYSYLFSTEFEVDAGAGAWHCSDIPFAFHNSELCPYANFDGSDELEEKYFGAYINFAKNGNPENDKLPAWAACEKDKETIMVFDKVCEAKVNYDHELIEYVMKYATPFSFGKQKVEH